MEWRRVLVGFFYLAKDQFWPFILFWLAVFLMRWNSLGGLISLAFVNGEWAVQFWLKAGYSYVIAFLVCAACGNIDLAMWFWFFKKGRFLLECKYPRAGEWFVRKFDPGQYEFSENDGKFRLFLKNVARNLSGVFTKHKYRGLLLMGATPFCGIIVGVPTAVGYKVKYGYWFMVLGNTLKIVVFGFIIVHKIILIGFVIFWLILILISKPRKKSA